jgi:hypothetical protein
MWCGYDKSFSTIVQDIQYTNKLVYLGFFIGEFFQKLVACMCSNIPASPGEKPFNIMKRRDAIFVLNLEHINTNVESLRSVFLVQ